MNRKQQRKLYMSRCRYYSYDGTCINKSIRVGNGDFLDFECDGDCQRMRRYDRKMKKEGGEK